VNLVIRDATVKDSDFLIEAIINAEKGNGNIVSYCAIFDITENEFASLMRKIFKEIFLILSLVLEIFKIADWRKSCAAYTGGLKESEVMPSGLLKMSAFKAFLDKRQIEHYHSIASVVDEVGIKRDHMTLQLETTYVREGYRGRGIVGLLTDALISSAKMKYPAISKAQVQLFKQNQAAVLSQTKLGFTIVEERTTENTEVLKYLPGLTRIKMQKSIG
jgi:ribosomal protein S18 acetylase RimI-like enzyme